MIEILYWETYGIHVASGIMAFVVAPGALLTTKGSRWHRRWGKLYFRMMAAVALSGLIVGTTGPRANFFFVLLGIAAATPASTSSALTSAASSICMRSAVARSCASPASVSGSASCHRARAAVRAALAAGRALRGIAVGRGNWTFAGSDRGGERAAAIYTLIETAKLNDIDPQAWLADVLARISDHPAKRLDELLPWNWKTAVKAAAAA